MKVLQIRLLGGFAVRINDQPVTKFRSAKSRALLAYLAIQPDQDHVRTTLATLLWGDLPETAAKTNLRIELSHLKKLLHSAPVLEITRQSVRFNSRLATVDAVTFDKNVRAIETLPIESQAKKLSELAKVVDLYEGEFLAGFNLPNALEYDEWQRIVQEKLHAQMMQALRILQQRYADQGSWAELARMARRQLEIVPWLESAHRHLIQALAAQGQRQAALTQYEKCCTILRDELGAEPARSTQGLAQRLRDDRLPTLPTNHNLSPQLKTFVGRKTEVERLLALLRSSRLVTLLGMGGVGKSRLAQAVAQNALGDFADGVWFVPLASINATKDASERIALVVASSIGFQISNMQTPLAELTAHLADKQMLLVLDNWEHLIDSAEVVVSQLLYRTQVHILATSRLRLMVDGEVLFPLEGLLPEDASILFTDRALSLLPAFGKGEDERNIAAEIDKICHQVGGLPLGIELAASWIEHFSVAEIGQSLADIGIEPQQSVDVVERHQSLNAVLDYSWRLLNESQQQILARLSIFHSGFDRAAVAAVADCSLSDLSMLISHSLVQRVSAGRYDLHPLVREFAGRKHRPDQESALLNRHSTHYLTILTTTERHNRGSHLLLDFENIRHAWQYAVQGKNAPLIQQAVTQFGEYVAQFDSLSDGYLLFEEAIKQFENEPTHNELVAQLLYQQWIFSRAIYGLSASSALQLRLLTLTDDLILHVKALSELANTHAEVSEWTKAEVYFDRAEAVARQSSDPHVYINAVEGRIHIYAVHFRGDYGQGVARLEELLALLDTIENPTVETENLRSRVLSSLQAVANRYGDYALALRCGRQTLAGVTRLAHQQRTSATLLELALTEQFAGMYQAAIAHNEQALAIAEEIGAADDIGLLKANLCLTLRQSGSLTQGLTYGLAAIEPLHALGLKRMEGQARNRVGHTLLALNRWDEAHLAYGDALLVWDALQHPNRMEAVAGRAVAALKLGDMKKAEAWVDEVLDFTAAEGVRGIVEPVLLYLHVEQVLSGLGRSAEANDVLHRAQAWVQMIAGRMSENAVRDSFLQRTDNRLLEKRIRTSGKGNP